jgi:hypothetical protein
LGQVLAAFRPFQQGERYFPAYDSLERMSRIQ